MNNLLITENVGKAYPMPKGVLRVFEGLISPSSGANWWP